MLCRPQLSMGTKWVILMNLGLVGLVWCSSGCSSVLSVFPLGWAGGGCQSLAAPTVPVDGAGVSAGLVGYVISPAQPLPAGSGHRDVHRAPVPLQLLRDPCLAQPCS